MYQIIKKDYKCGILTSLFSAISLYTILVHIIPIFGQAQTEHYALYRIGMSNLSGNNTTSILQSLYFPYTKIVTVFVLLAEYLFLPLLSSFTYLLVFPYLALRFTSKLDELWILYMHYNANLQPFLVISSAMSIRWLTQKITLAPKYLKAAVATVVITSVLKFTSIIGIYTVNNLTVIKQRHYLDSQLNKIPLNAAVSAQDTLVPHLANRAKIYLFPDIQKADYVVLDSQLYPGFYFTPIQMQKSQSEINDYSKWERIYQYKTFLIYKRKSPSTQPTSST